MAATYTSPAHSSCLVSALPALDVLAKQESANELAVVTLLSTPIITTPGASQGEERKAQLLN